MRRSKSLVLIYCLAILESILLIARYGIVTVYDSTSYVTAWNTISSGVPDALRTPVYPLFLHIMDWLFSKNALFATVCFQHLFFLVSIYFFHRILSSLINSERTVLFITLFYAVFPAANTWANLILTESLAISGFILLIFLCFRCLHNPSYVNGILFTLQLIVLLFLRPIFIYLLPVFFVAYVYLTWTKKTERKAGITGLACVTVATLLLLGYMHTFNRVYGRFSVSNVSNINGYIMARQNDMVDPDIIDDISFRHDVDSLLSLNGTQNPSVFWEEALFLASTHPADRFAKELSNMKRNYPKKALYGILKRFINSSKQPLLVTSLWGITRVSAYGLFFIGGLYLFLFFYSVYLLAWIIRNEQIPWRTSLLYMLGVSNIIIAVVGAQAEWTRLIYPSLPIWLIFIGQLCERFQKKPLDEITLP